MKKLFESKQEEAALTAWRYYINLLGQVREVMIGYYCFITSVILGRIVKWATV